MKRTRSTIELGGIAEAEAELWLTRQGLRLVARNFRCRRGEIDLIMRDGNTLVFVEVRLRRHRNFGGAEASVDRAKQRRLSAAAGYYLAARPALSALPCRFDVMAMTPAGDAFKYNWIRDAFAAWE